MDQKTATRLDASDSQLPPSTGANPTHLREINEGLYKQNLELAVKNKTLSLLGDLYETSILNLDPAELAQKITNSIQRALDLELVSIMLYSQDEDELSSLASAKSEHFKVVLQKIPEGVVDTKITATSEKNFFAPLIGLKHMVYTENFSDIWVGVLDLEIAKQVGTEARIKSSLAYPLKTGGKLTGILILSLNRTYESLNPYEQESIKSFINVIAVALDRSLVYQELKNANKRLKELNELKNEFMSLATHQIRSPLTAIKGYASLMLEDDYGKLPASLVEPIKVIYKSCDTLIKIVGEFLDISRIEQGGMRYEKVKLNFRAIVEEVVHEFKPSIEAATNVEFKSNLEVGDYKMLGDIVKLKQVVNNLIDNAIKYTKEGEVVVILKRSENNIRLSVRDTGIGLSKEKTEKLFSKFSRLDNAARTDVMGTGLGLYVARGIVEAHNGKIWADSPGEGQGSTFSVELPV